MKTAIARRLLGLNRVFYDTFAADFADSRSDLQPGILRALRSMKPYRSLVDIGCGDGRVGRALGAGAAGHIVERYVGVDFSSRLLDRAASPSQALPAHFRLVALDLTRPGWSLTGELSTEPFEAAACFSMLHHVPGPRRRLRLLREIRSILQPGAECVLSVWQFLHVLRLRRKIVPWPEIGLRAEAVDTGDYLLDWQRGGRGLRYVHHFEEAELIALCQCAGFQVNNTYRSDGQTGDMGLYAHLKAVIY